MPAELNNRVLTSEERNYLKLIEEFGESDLGIMDRVSGEFTPLVEGSKIIPPKLPKKNSKGELLDTEFRPCKNKEKFMKVFVCPIDQLIEKLSYKEFTIFVKLSKYVSIHENALYNYSTKSYLKIKDLSELLEINYDNLRKIFKRYEELDLIQKVKIQSQKDVYKTINAYVVNPYVLLNGSYPTVQTSMLFKNSNWSKI